MASSCNTLSLLGDAGDPEVFYLGLFVAVVALPSGSLQNTGIHESQDFDPKVEHEVLPIPNPHA